MRKIFIGIIFLYIILNVCLGDTVTTQEIGRVYKFMPNNTPLINGEVLNTNDVVNCDYVDSVLTNYDIKTVVNEKIINSFTNLSLSSICLTQNVSVLIPGTNYEADTQLLIDSQPKNLNNYKLTFLFEPNENRQTECIVIDNFYGGSIVLKSDSSSDVFNDVYNTESILLSNNQASVSVKNLAWTVTGANTNIIKCVDNMYININNCEFDLTGAILDVDVLYAVYSINDVYILFDYNTLNPGCTKIGIKKINGFANFFSNIYLGDPETTFNESESAFILKARQYTKNSYSYRQQFIGSCKSRKYGRVWSVWTPDDYPGPPDSTNATIGGIDYNYTF